MPRRHLTGAVSAWPISPLSAYFALIVTFAQKYDKKAGVGTVVSLMIRRG